MSICRANQVLGLPLYYISRHVASTFKRLATVRVNLQVMIPHMTLSIILIVTAEQ
jgi:ABC-type sulfate transport system permease component